MNKDFYFTNQDDHGNEKKLLACQRSCKPDLAVNNENNTTPLPVAKYFKEFIHASVSGSRYPAPGKRISKGTISNYLYVLCFLNEYETR